MGVNVNEVDAFLEHHGVKGQKWGIRNRSKIFAPTTKEERKRIRNSASAKQGRKTLVKIGASISVGVGTGTLAQHFAKKKFNAPVSKLIGDASALVGGGVAAKILDVNGTKRTASLKKKAEDRKAERQGDLLLGIEKPKNAKEREYVKTTRKELSELDRLFRESKFKTAEQMGLAKTKRINELADKYMG